MPLFYLYCYIFIKKAIIKVFFPSLALQKAMMPLCSAFPFKIFKFAMWSPFSLLMLAGLTCCCVSLPQIQYVNDKPYHLMQQTECRGGKIFEINDVQDIDECKAACLHRNCRAVNLFQVGEFAFKCEILAYVHGFIPAQGAACYISYY